MDSPEFITASGIAVVLAALAGVFAWRAVVALRGLAGQAPEERAFVRSQASRRLAGCVLMLTLAGMLGGRYWFGQEGRAFQAALEEKTGTNETPAPPGEGPRHSRNAYGIFWAVFMLVLFGWVTLAFWDLWAIRRFGVRHYRKIQADRRAMIEEELARLRPPTDRNGHG